MGMLPGSVSRLAPHSSRARASMRPFLLCPSTSPTPPPCAPAVVGQVVQVHGQGLGDGVPHVDHHLGRAGKKRAALHRMQGQVSSVTVPE